MHLCVRGRIPVHLLEGWRLRWIHVWGVGFRCIYLRDDDFSAFMCEGKDLGAFTTKKTISVNSCVRGKSLVHLLEGWRFRCIHVWGASLGAFTWGVTISGHLCVRGTIPVHLPEEWWFQCIHLWGVPFHWIDLRSDDLVRSCVRGKIPVHLLEGWWFWCIHV